MTRILISCIAVVVLATTLLRAQSIELPFHADHDRQVLIAECMVNGHPAHMIVDTGASVTTVAPALVGVRVRGSTAAQFERDTAGITGTGTWMHVKVQIGSAELDSQAFVMNLDAIAKRVGEPVDGLIGLDLLRRFRRVTFDFEGQKLILERNATTRSTTH